MTAARSRGGLPAAAHPSESTSFFSQRKLSQDAPAPSANPSPHRQPCQISRKSTPAMLMTAMNTYMRATDRGRLFSSRSIVAGVTLKLPDQLHESGGDAEDEEHDIQKMRMEGLI